MDYTALVQDLTIKGAQAAPPSYTLPTDFTNQLPRFIDYAEGRIYRDLVLLATRAQDSSLTCTPGSRSLNLSAMSTVIIVPEGLALITPAGNTPAAGTRIPFDEASLDTIDMVWPVEATTLDPSSTTAINSGRYWAMKDAQTMVLCPTPAGAYKAEITGLFRPAPISAGNPTTYISLTYPELLEAACMIAVSSYLREYGASADDPRMAVSWESQYTTLRDSALAEEMRRRGQGTGWSPNTPTPLATPQRT